MTYKQLEAIYNQYFSLGNLNININNKFALISLICYIVTSMRKKKPDVTYYQVVHKICDGRGFEDDFINEDMVKTCRDILESYMPF